MGASIPLHPHLLSRDRVQEPVCASACRNIQDFQLSFSAFCFSQPKSWAAWCTLQPRAQMSSCDTVSFPLSLLELYSFTTANKRLMRRPYFVLMVCYCSRVWEKPCRSQGQLVKIYNLFPFPLEGMRWVVRVARGRVFSGTGSLDASLPPSMSPFLSSDEHANETPRSSQLLGHTKLRQ